MRGNSRGTGPRPTGKRDARAAFPDAHPQPVGCCQRGKFDIRAFGKQQVALQCRPLPRHVDRVGIRDEQHAMRVSHANGNRSTGQWQVQRIHGPGKRHLGPVQLRLAHVDADQPIGAAQGVQCAACRADAHAVLPCPPHHMIRDAARGIAAGAGPGAVAVPEIQRDIGVIRIPDFRQLVESDAAIAVPQRACQRSRCHRPASARVDHDKVVAQPMHFHEGQSGYGALRGHRGAYTPLSCVLPA